MKDVCKTIIVTLGLLLVGYEVEISKDVTMTEAASNVVKAIKEMLEQK